MRRVKLPFLCLLVRLFAACSDDAGGARPGTDVDADEVDAPDAADATATGDVDVAVDEDTAADAADDGTDDPEHPYADSLLLSDRFLNIAHRGGGRLAPEETLPAYENAVAIGVDVIEIDVHSTADGVIVCMHDDTVDRTTDGVGRIQDMTFDALRMLDAGHQFTPDGGETFPYRGQGVVVPTAEEVLTAFPDMYFSIEIKQASPSIAAGLVALVESFGMESQVVIASFDDRTITEVREANPDLITAFALGEMIAFLQVTEETVDRYTAPGLVLQVPPVSGQVDALSPSLLALAHGLGLRVQVWTINDRDEMERIIGLGVDGIFTDDPATLAEVVDALGVRD